MERISQWNALLSLKAVDQMLIQLTLKLWRSQIFSYVGEVN